MPVREWHAANLPEIFAALDAGEAGLSSAEAASRLSRFGPNRLPRPEPPALARMFLRQFLNPLIYILGAAAIASILTEHGTDAAFIGFVLLLNASIGAVQEWRAEKSSRALQSLLEIRATVTRDGEVREVSAEELVPGDVIWLESGNRVPADARLVAAHALEVDESLLTGESLPVPKDERWKGPLATPVADRINMAHAGSIVARGRAKAVVVATGSRTTVGQVALDVEAAAGSKPPLLLRMERFTRAVALAVLAASVVLGLLALLRGHPPSDVFLFAVALAVSAIPEGLPVALTIALAVAASRMARRGVIVRRLAAVEGLGSCTLIASDKTGTLTCNELTVRELRLPGGEVIEVDGAGYAPAGEIHAGVREREGLARLALAAALCNEADLHRRDGAWVWRGDPTDVALLCLAHKAGVTREASLDRHRFITAIPFEPERRFAASYHRDGALVRVFVKGAPEQVLAMCEGVDRPALLAVSESLAARGLRVLALAAGGAPTDLDPSKLPPEPSGLTFLGFAGMIDPLRMGVREAVAACASAGVTVCMVTGDHPVTALAIARDLGLPATPAQVVSAADLEGRTGAELEAIVARARVFARVSPRQKLEIVEAAQRAGHFVAVTGDGVNDAPALRAANIGVAMGRAGTDVARETAALVITDDNFATIVAGVEEGRVAYENVRKVIYLLISTGAAEIVLVGLAMGTGLPLPLLPAQLLWLNLVTNGIQDVALAFEPGEGDELSRPPRPPRERIFNRLMIERCLIAAATMGGVGFVTFGWMLSAGWSEAAARNGLLLLMVLFENVHIGNCRSERRSAFRLSPLRSPVLLSGAILALIVHLASLHLPLAQKVLGTRPVDPATGAVFFGLALTVLVAMEIHKWVRARGERRGGRDA